MNAEVREATKKPVTIQYMVWPGGADNATPVIDWVLAKGGTARYHERRWCGTQKVDGVEEDYYDDEHIAIVTLEGSMRTDPGSVVIQGVQGEFYPCKPDIFRETYDLGKVVES